MKYGVKLNNGKIMWVVADSFLCTEGAVIFYRGEGESRVAVAGFSLAQVNHWGIPDAFAAE